MKTFLMYFVAFLFLILLITIFSSIGIILFKLAGISPFILISGAIVLFVFTNLATVYRLDVYEGGKWYTDGIYKSLTEIDDRLDKLGEVVEDYKIKTIYKHR
jgi:hypothetical protein